MEKVGEFSLPSLRKECLAWLASTPSSQPSGVNNPSAIGDADRAFTTAILQGDDSEAGPEQKRESAIAKLDELLRQKLAISFIPTGEYTPVALMGALATLRESCAQNMVTSTSAVGEKTKGTLYLCSAELFHVHAYNHNPGERFFIVLLGVNKSLELPPPSPEN